MRFRTDSRWTFTHWIRLGISLALVITPPCLGRTAPSRGDGAEDSVHVWGGATVSGAVREIHPTHVVVERRGKSERIELPKIERIRWAGEPTELSAARDAVQRENWTDARTRIDTLLAIEPTTLSTAVRVEIQFLDSVTTAESAFNGRGDLDASRAKLFEFAKQNRESIFFYPAVERLADVEWARGDGPAAIRFWEQSQKAPWPDYQVKSLTRQARIRYAMQQPDEALKSWKSLSNVKDITAAQHALADAGTALCQSANKKPTVPDSDDAVATIERLIRDTDPDQETAWSGIYLSLGYTHLLKNQPAKALLAFLHVDALYEGQKHDHAEALAQLVPLWEQQGRQDRARETAARLQDRYGGTHWGRSQRSPSTSAPSSR